MVTHGFGATLTWNSQVVANLNSVGGLKLTIDSRETTVHKTADRFKTFGAGLVEAGDIPIVGYFDHTDTNGQIAMVTDAQAGTERTYLVTLPSSTGATLTGTGFITEISTGEMDTEGNIPFSATIKPTGKPTFAVTAVVGMSACGFSNDVLMMPTFAIGTYEYAVTITNGQTSTIVTPVDATSGEVITITGPNGASQVVATGVASSAIAIASDALNDIVVVISKTGCSSKTYTFHCAVLAS